MKKILLLILLMLFACPIFAAEEITVNVKADKLKYAEGRRIVKAEGNCEVQLKDLTIKADTLNMDTETNIVTAEGNVVIFTKEYSAEGESVIYNIDNEKASFEGFSTVLSPPDVKGKLYLTSRYLDDQKDKMLGKKGTITTCDYKDAHYWVSAEKVEYYPNDKVVGYNATLWQTYIDKSPLLWTPYILYDLKKKKRKNWVFGENEVEGKFLKTTWDHPKGTVYLDWMEKKGWGKGFDTEYKLSPKQTGDFYLYHIFENDTQSTDWVSKLNHTYQIDKENKLSLSQNYSNIYLVPSGRYDETSSKINYSHQGKHQFNMGLDLMDNRYGLQDTQGFRLSDRYKDLNLNYNYASSHAQRTPFSRNTNQSLNYEFPFLLNSRFSNSINYYNNTSREGDAADERLQPALTLTQPGPFYSLKIYRNWDIDLDGNKYGGDIWNEYVEKQPEIICSLNPIDLKLFSLGTNLTYGKYREVKYLSQTNNIRDYTTNRYQLTEDANKTIPLILGTSLSLGYAVDQNLYEPGDAMYAVRKRVGLSTGLFDHFRNSINYGHGYTDGNTPFFFDQLGANYHDVKDRLTLYNQDKLVWETEGGYNYLTSKYFDLLTGLTIKPSNRLKVTLNTGYDLENKRYHDLVSSFFIIPIEGITEQLDLVRDLNANHLKTGSSLFDFDFNKNDWVSHFNIRFGHVYSFEKDQFEMKDIAFIKDLHCVEFKYAYSDYRKEFSYMFSVKAFPEEPFGWQSGRGLYFESYEMGKREMEGELKGESPSRY